MLSFRRNRLSKRLFFGATLAIGLTMIPLVVVLQVTDGMIAGITDRYIETSSFHFTATPGFGDIKSAEIAEEQLKALDRVIGVYPFTSSFALLSGKDKRFGVQVRGLPATIYQNDAEFRRYLEFSDGAFDFNPNGRGLLISRALAERLEVDVGDTARALLASRLSGAALLPKLEEFTISGVFSTGYRELDLMSAFIDLDTAKTLFPDPQITRLGIKVSDRGRDVEKLSQDISSVLEENWQISSWAEQNQSMFNSLRETRQILLFILGLILLVASTTITSSMLNLVTEKQEHIAILRSLGARSGDIGRQFLYSGLLIGACAAVVGSFGGLALAVNINQAVRGLEGFINQINRALTSITLTKIDSADFNLLNPEYYLQEIPITLRFVDLAAVALFTILLVVVASAYPAWRAGKVKPLTVIRRR